MRHRLRGTVKHGLEGHRHSHVIVPPWTRSISCPKASAINGLSEKVRCWADSWPSRSWVILGAGRELEAGVRGGS